MPVPEDPQRYLSERALMSVLNARHLARKLDDAAFGLRVDPRVGLRRVAERSEDLDAFLSFVLMALHRAEEDEPALARRLRRFLAAAAHRVDHVERAVAKQDMLTAATAVSALAHYCREYAEFGGSVAIMLRPVARAA